MRLIQILHGWPPEHMGGTGLYVKALSQALNRAGHSVSIIAPGKALRPRLESTGTDGVSGWRLLQPPALTWKASWQRRSGLDLWDQLLDRSQPDRVHIHHLSGLPLGLVTATQAAGIPVTMTLHDYWLPCHRGQLVDRSLTLCHGPTPAGCATCRTGAVAPSIREQTRVAARTAAATEAIAAVDVLLSPSRDLSDRIEAMGLPRPSLCPLPLVHPPAPPAPESDGPVRFLFASSIIPTKGPQVLLEAFSKLTPGPTLTYAGHDAEFVDAPDFGVRLARLARGTPGVQWRGPIPPKDVPALMANHDVLVLPSLWPENSPLVIREATAAGLRIITSREGGGAELAPEATLVTPGDVDQLAAALQAEAAKGRGRAPRRNWQTPAENAEWLLQHAYEAGRSPMSGLDRCAHPVEQP